MLFEKQDGVACAELVELELKARPGTPLHRHRHLHRHLNLLHHSCGIITNRDITNTALSSAPPLLQTNQQFVRDKSLTYLCTHINRSLMPPQHLQPCSFCTRSGPHTNSAGPTCYQLPSPMQLLPRNPAQLSCLLSIIREH